MSISKIPYNSLLPDMVKRANDNFDYLTLAGLPAGKGVWKSLAWGVSPGSTVDSSGQVPAAYSRASTAYYFNANGYAATAAAGSLRMVPGEYGARAAMKVEGTSTNLFPRAVVSDTNSDGVADGWVAIGTEASLMCTIETSTVYTDSDQKVLTIDAEVPTGIEAELTASTDFLDKSYLVSVVAKISRGEPTNFEALVRAYNSTNTLIYKVATPLAKLKDVGPNSGYAVYTAKVTTPTVLDFGNIAPYTTETVSTASICVRVASTTEMTVNVWHTQIQEGALTSPIRTVDAAATSTADVLQWAWPQDLSQSGSLSFWSEIQPSSTGTTYLLFGKAGQTRVEVVGGRIRFVMHGANDSEYSVMSKAAINLCDGHRHHILASWDSYVGTDSYRHMPIYLAVDGVDQLTSGVGGAVLDERTQRPCVDAAADATLESWSVPDAIYISGASTFAEVENPFITASPVGSVAEVEAIYKASVPLLCSSVPEPKTLVYKRASGVAEADQTEITLEMSPLEDSESVFVAGAVRDKDADEYTIDYSASKITLATPMDAETKYFVMYAVLV